MAYRIGIDISSGDNAPGHTFAGALAAAQQISARIVLVGLRSDIEREAAKHKADIGRFDIIEAPEKIGMDEPPTVAIRKKRNSSISVGAGLLRDKKIDAFVSCGNTGALVCAATVLTGMIEGVERPGIAIPMSTQKKPSLIVDVGANTACKPLHLLHYAAMAGVYYEIVMGKKNPTVGLLNIGEEETKGTDLYKNAYKLLSAAPINFIGNLEAKHLFAGDCDCIVCDGLMGNIALKVAEGCAGFMMKSMKDIILGSLFGKIGGLFLSGAMRNFKKKMDYSEHGGAPLLGIDGIFIKAHGISDAHAVKNALRVAAHELTQHVHEAMKDKVQEVTNALRVQAALSTING